MCTLCVRYVCEQVITNRTNAHLVNDHQRTTAALRSSFIPSLSRIHPLCRACCRPVRSNEVTVPRREHHWQSKVTVRLLVNEWLVRGNITYVAAAWLVLLDREASAGQRLWGVTLHKAERPEYILR